MKSYRQIALGTIVVATLTVVLITLPARSDSNNSGHDATPFQQEIHVAIAAGAGQGFASSTQIPAGKRLIIENISAQAGLPAGQRLIIFVTPTAGGTTVQHNLLVTFQANIGGYDELVASEVAKLYADPRSYVQIGVFLSSLAGPSDVWVKLTGRLVPCGHDPSCPLEE